MQEHVEPNFVAWLRFLGEGSASLGHRTGLTRRQVIGAARGSSAKAASKIAVELGVPLGVLETKHPRDVPDLAEEAARRCAWRRLDGGYRRITPTIARREMAEAIAEIDALAEAVAVSETV